jgi:hypothetical protein
MKCQSCETEVPSNHYLDQNGLCRACAPQPAPARKTDKNRIIQLVSKAVYMLMGLLSLALFGVALGMIGYLISPESFTFNSYQDFFQIYQVTPAPVELQVLHPGFRIDRITHLAMIDFTMDRPWLALSFFIFFALFLLFNLRLLYRLNQILKSVETGSPFNPANINRIREIGVLVIIMQLWLVAWGFVAGQLVSFPFDLAAGQLTGYHGFWYDGITEALWGILVGTILLILAEVFRYGLDLQEEQDLTV